MVVELTVRLLLAAIGREPTTSVRVRELSHRRHLRADNLAAWEAAAGDNLRVAGVPLRRRRGRARRIVRRGSTSGRPTTSCTHPPALCGLPRGDAAGGGPLRRVGKLWRITARGVDAVWADQRPLPGGRQGGGGAAQVEGAPPRRAPRTAQPRGWHSQ